MVSAKNHGVKISSGDIICFLEDDETLDIDYLKNINKVFTENQFIMGCSGVVSNVRRNIIYVYAFKFFHQGLFLDNRVDAVKYLDKGLDILIQSNHISGGLSSYRKEVFQYIKHTTKSKQKVHLELNNGDPLLIDFKRGNGKVFYFSSILDLEWNDMPLRGLLVPLMYKLLVLGGTDEVNSMPVKLGRVKWIALDDNEVKSEWEVESPSGIKNLIVPDFNKESLKIKNTNELGVYNVYKNKILYTSFTTELNSNEIISSQITQNEIDILFPELEYKWINPSDDFINVFNEIRHGKALWKFFLILAIILVLLETWVGRPIVNNIKS